MSAGQIHVPVKLVYDALVGILSGASIKMAIIDSSITPLVTDSWPVWGPGGTQNYALAEVAAGGNYVTGGVAITGLAEAIASAICNVSIDSPITITGDPANPTTGRWCVFYDNAATPKRVVCFGDFGIITSIVTGLQLKVNGSLVGNQPLIQGQAS